MSQVPPLLGDFARRLFVHEAGGRQRTQDFVDAMERACRALHARLAPLLSASGVNALFRRAVSLAARDFPFLTGAITALDCSQDSLRQAAEGHDPAKVAEALVAILANFLWLLVIFVGESLGMRKVQEAWPDVPLIPPGSSLEKAQL